MPELEILVGMIASGKSTWSANKAKRGNAIVNDDSIVMAVHGGNYQLYNRSFKAIYKAVGLEIAKTALIKGINVTIDCTNRTSDSRRRWIGLAQSLDCTCSAIVFHKESVEVHAQRRASSDSRGYSYEYWLEVAKQHEKDWQDPCFYEGFDSIKEVKYDGNNTFLTIAITNRQR